MSLNNRSKKKNKTKIICQVIRTEFLHWLILANENVCYRFYLSLTIAISCLNCCYRCRCHTSAYKVEENQKFYMIIVQMLADLKQKSSDSILNLLTDSSHLQAMCNFVFAQIIFVITIQFLDNVISILMVFCN